LLDIETRTEQLRQIKTFEPRRLIIQGLTAGGVLMGAGAAIGALFVHLVHG
jgi:protease II